MIYRYVSFQAMCKCDWEGEEFDGTCQGEGDAEILANREYAAHARECPEANAIKEFSAKMKRHIETSFDEG